LPNFDYPNGFADTDAANPDATSAQDMDPSAPKSLYLLHPLLLGAYTLRPVASEAQASVHVPEGLDLDTWVVKKAKDAVLGPLREAGEGRVGEGRDEGEDGGVRRKKKGKGERGQRKGKGKEKAGEEADEGASMPRAAIEEAEVRARVGCFMIFLLFQSVSY